MSVRNAVMEREGRSIDESQSRAIAAREVEQSRPRSAMELMAMRLNVSPQSLQNTLKNTAFKGCSDAEFVALVVVSNTYNLNPLLREIYAFPKKGGGIQAIIGYDGWIKIMNDHPQFDGVEFDHIEDGNGNLKAVEGIIYRKDRNRPTKKLVYLKEFKRNTEPWNNSPNHMLDVRCLCHTVRIAFGVSAGIEGEDDRIDNGPVYELNPVRSLPSNKSLADELDDGIPDFDKRGQRQDHDAETGEVTQRDSRGMTEVSEDEARALDAGDTNDGTYDERDNPTAEEGPTQDQRGEANTDDEPAYLAKVRGVREKLAAAKTVKAVEGIDRDWTNTIRNSIDDEKLVASVDRDIAARKRELREEG